MQVNAEHAQTQASRADQVVQDEIDQFEKMKLTDIKVFQLFIHFHRVDEISFRNILLILL